MSVGEGAGLAPMPQCWSCKLPRWSRGYWHLKDGPGHSVTNHMPTCIQDLSNAFLLFFFFLSEVCCLL